MFAIGPSELLILLLLILLVGTVFWIWMLVDCATKEPTEGNTKVVWVIIIVFTHLIGAAIYFLVRRPKRIAEVEESSGIQPPDEQ